VKDIGFTLVDTSKIDKLLNICSGSLCSACGLNKGFMKAIMELIRP
jgi:hypothetical protein